MDLVGREVELASVSRALDDVRAGGTRVLGVLGEAGIGKSALLAAIADLAAPLRVAAGRAAEHERDLPFALAFDALDGHVTTIAHARMDALNAEFGIELEPTLTVERCIHAPRTNAAERFRFHRLQGAVLESLGPIVMLFDDVQWADDASLEVILHFLARPPEVPHLLAFALRPAVVAARLLDTARRHPGFEQLTLEPLDDAAARAMLGDVRDRERHVRDAAGNPLFLRELSRAAGERSRTLPATLQAAIAREVERLGEPARTLLAGAAVAGDPFDPELAAIAAGVWPDAATLDALVSADLVRAHAGVRGFAFRHPVVRRAVYDAAPPAWRLAAHERVAGALEARGAGAAARAYHVTQFARAGDERAIALLMRAGEATARSSPAAAANWYAAALPLVPEGDRGTVLGPLALALAGAGRLEESLARLQEALELDSANRELILACARVETLRGRYAQARRRLHAAYTAKPHPSLAFELAAAAMTANDAPALRGWAATAQRLATHPAAAGLDAVLVAASRVLGALGDVWSGERRPGADLLAPLDALDDRLVGAHPTVLLHVSRALMRLERVEDASATLKRAVAIGRGTSSGEMLVWLLGVQAWTLWLQLDLHAALAAAEAAEEAARMQTAPNPLLLALSVRAAIHHERGEAHEAERSAAACQALIAGLEPSDTTRMAAATLACLHVADDPERCLLELERAELDASWAGRSALCRVRASLALGHIDDADQIAQAAARESARVDLPLAAVRAELGTAEVLLAWGESKAAAALAAVAADVADATGALEAAEARLVQGRALSAAGEHEAAKAVLQRVAADAARGGGVRLRNAASRELRVLGTRISANGRRSERGELSTREREIAALVAGGRSNKQVAATLYLSEKTIENALTRVYAKLGVRTRAQLARGWAN
ncbi:AAA family ATPase [Solirubrobacter ginsenosidimutans]|uniref:AAA family ATPase n=1 Tax=Solirubrobacter ginsenosidimutans TaxID=490573 RepID=A0A9X3MXY3_9ACTN|nr:AAA family ATPase [Solirubrobacter ginsenosidimutans]MDA0163676.1 AAA family ATPase [Solirubrobacter ginsenosidimutans]